MSLGAKIHQPPSGYELIKEGIWWLVPDPDDDVTETPLNLTRELDCRITAYQGAAGLPPIENIKEVNAVTGRARAIRSLEKDQVVILACVIDKRRGLDNVRRSTKKLAGYVKPNGKTGAAKRIKLRCQYVNEEGVASSTILELSPVQYAGGLDAINVENLLQYRFSLRFEAVDNGEIRELTEQTVALTEPGTVTAKIARFQSATGAWAAYGTAPYGTAQIFEVWESPDTGVVYIGTGGATNDNTRAPGITENDTVKSTPGITTSGTPRDVGYFSSFAEQISKNTAYAGLNSRRWDGTNYTTSYNVLFRKAPITSGTWLRDGRVGAGFITKLIKDPFSDRIWVVGSYLQGAFGTGSTGPTIMLGYVFDAVGEFTDNFSFLVYSTGGATTAYDIAILRNQILIVGSFTNLGYRFGSLTTANNAALYNLNNNQVTPLNSSVPFYSVVVNRIGEFYALGSENIYRWNGTVWEPQVDNISSCYSVSTPLLSMTYERATDSIFVTGGKDKFYQLVARQLVSLDVALEDAAPAGGTSFNQSQTNRYVWTKNSTASAFYTAVYNSVDYSGTSEALATFEISNSSTPSAYNVTKTYGLIRNLATGQSLYFKLDPTFIPCTLVVDPSSPAFYYLVTATGVKYNLFEFLQPNSAINNFHLKTTPGGANSTQNRVTFFFPKYKASAKYKNTHLSFD
jgi:hypothetical protein